MRRALKIVALPVTVLALFGVLYAVWRLLGMPPEETIRQAAKVYLDRYGIGIVLIAAYLEGLLLIGWYFPGTLVIVLALVLAAPAPEHFVLVAATAGVGLLSAFATNFCAGKYGWYRLLLAFGMREPLENAQRRLTRYGLSAIFMTYWQANLASCTSTAAGILQFPLARFLAYSLAAEAMWITFWAILIFGLGGAAMTLVGFRMVLLLIMLWIVARLIYRWTFERERAAE